MKSDQNLPSKKKHRLIFSMAALLLSMTAGAGPRPVAATLTATTANMTPAGENLRIQIIEWQEADARTNAVATLAAGADASPPLAKLPTVGYIWPKGSPVGYSVKYAHREPQPDGGERITLVTDKRLGSYDFKGWSTPSPGAGGDAPYSVVELDLSSAGSGTGTLSLVSEVVLDEQAGTVVMKPGGPSLLTNVKRETTSP